MRGTTFRSKIIYAITNDKEEFSHAGIIHVFKNTPYIVHATPKINTNNNGDKVIVETLAGFLRHSRITDISILRLKTDKDGIASTVAERSEYYAKQLTPFDHQFNLQSDDKLYCTELIWYAYLYAGIDLINNQFDKLDNPVVKGNAILPSSLKRSRYLHEILSYQSK